MGQCRRRRGQRIADRAGGHADWTAIVRQTIVMMTALAIGMRERRNLRVALTATDRVDVTKGQAKIDDERDQRQPRTLPDMVTKQTHPKPSHPLASLANDQS